MVASGAGAREIDLPESTATVANDSNQSLAVQAAAHVQVAGGVSGRAPRSFVAKGCCAFRVHVRPAVREQLNVHAVDAVTIASADLETSDSIPLGIQHKAWWRWGWRRRGNVSWSTETNADRTPALVFSRKAEALHFVIAAATAQVNRTRSARIASIRTRETKSYRVAAGRFPSSRKSSVAPADEADRKSPVPLQDDVSLGNAITAVADGDSAGAFRGGGQFRWDSVDGGGGKNCKEKGAKEQFHAKVRRRYRSRIQASRNKKESR